MKIFLSKINESWVVDRFRKDWYISNPNISTEKIKNSDIIWIISPWLWKKIPKKHLKQKKVVCSIYHIDFDTFTESDLKDFELMDTYVDFYHVISDHTKIQLSKLTNKQIISIPFWVDNKIFKNLVDKSNLRKNLGFNNEDYLIGSFQRDTEGKDLKSPKLIKGPDIFLEIIKKYYSQSVNSIVVLTGKRRDYLINNFKEQNIKYKYFEMLNVEEVNKLYNILDLYIVSSRVEGGPQAIMECAISKTPIVSTDVGIAPQVLNPISIYKNIEEFKHVKPDINFAYNKAVQYVIPIGMSPYIKMFKELYES